MQLRVKYDELQETGKYINEKNEELKEVFDNIQKLIDEIPNAWKGVDSEIFVKNATEYMNIQKEKRKKVETLGAIITKVSGNYKNKDAEWEDKIKKESRIDEYRNNRK